MSPTNDDMYSLESWLREKALEAHNKAMDKSKTEMQRSVSAGEYYAYEVTISKIQSGRVSQRPHIRITEEFDGLH